MSLPYAHLLQNAYSGRSLRNRFRHISRNEMKSVECPNCGYRIAYDNITADPTVEYGTGMLCEIYSQRCPSFDKYLRINDIWENTETLAEIRSDV